MRVLILLALAACSTSPQHTVRAAIADAWLEHLSAVRAKNAAAVGALYGDDIVYIVPGEAEVRGREAIDRMEAEGLATAEILDVTHETHGLLVSGDVAYELGTVEGPVQPHGQASKVVTFRYMARWKRQADGHWRIQCMVGQPE